MSELGYIFRFRDIKIQGQKYLSPAPLLSPGFVPLVSQKMLHARKHKRPEPSFSAIHCRKIIVGKQPCKKRLSQIFGILPTVSVPAHKCIERIPVYPAQLLQRVSCKGIFLPCSDDHGPVGFMKPAGTPIFIKFGLHGINLALKPGYLKS